MLPNQRRITRRRKKQRSTTLDPTEDLSRYSSSVSPSPTDRDSLKLKKTDKKRMAKSKSPSGYKSQLKDKIKKKNKKSRRRANSDIDVLVSPLNPITLKVNVRDTETTPKAIKNKARPMSTTIVRKKKKKKKYAQTPGTNSIGSMMNTDDPFGMKKKQKSKSKQTSMTPIVSLTSTIDDDVYSYSDDDDVTPRSQSARFSSVNGNKIVRKRSKICVRNSKSIAETQRVLNAISSGIKEDINNGFNLFHNALNKRQNKLLNDLESVYNDKKDSMVIIEQKLFENGKKSKNAKAIEYEFDPNINFVSSKDALLNSIKKYGYIDSDSAIKDDDKKELEEDEEIDDDNDQVITMAAKQKEVLGSIQNKTMEKLDLVILMEKEAKKKALQAAMLTKQVDEGLKYIAERTKIINEKIATAAPELEKARAAVENIDAKSINEIKTLKAPPIVIENVITATVMILGHNIKTWRDVQKLLSYKFKPQLLNFDTYSLSKETRQKVYKKYAGKQDFNYDRVYQGNKVCGNLVLWVLSQIKYSRMLDIIIPLEKEVKKLKKDSKKKQKMAKELLKIVNELEENIKLYTDQCNQMIDHIIKSTENELKQFSDKLQPLNEKFNAILNNKVLH